MKLYKLFILFIVGIFYCGSIHAQDDKKAITSSAFMSSQNDSLVAKDTTPVKAKKDTVRKHDPRIATRRSAIIPGWGQAYNREYWKIPLVYAALAIPTFAYFYNNSYYEKTKFGYEAMYAATVKKDSSLIPLIDPSVKNLDGTPLSAGSYQNYRNSFRRNRDYSVLWFIIAWGVQVVDATVFAHLKQFDVSSDLSMEINPSFNPQTRTPALALTLNLKSPQRKQPIAR